MAFEPDTVAGTATTPALTGRPFLTDLALVGSVPCALGLVHLLPRGLRQSLVFDYAAPTVATAFASAFVHLGPVHLLVNVGLYALVAPVGLALSVAAGRRRRFRTIFATFVLAFPAVLSYLNLAVPRSASALGFSGVVMAFAGYLPFVLATYLETRFDIGPTTQLAPFLASLSLVSVVSVRSVFALVGSRAAGLSLAALLGAVWYGLTVRERCPTLRADCRALLRTPGAAELVVATLVLVAAVPFVAFPSTPVLGAATPNLYVHLRGYALGFLVPFVAATATSRLVTRRTAV